MDKELIFKKLRFGLAKESLIVNALEEFLEVMEYGFKVFKCFIVSSLLLFLLSSQYLCYSQNIEDRFWHVTEKELLSEPDTNETSNKAIVLFEYSKVYFKDFDKYDNIIQNYHVRMKILNEEGFGLGTVNIPVYFQDDKKESVENIVGATYNVENGEIIKTSIEKNAIQKITNDRHCKTICFKLPNVKVGSVIEYSYEKATNFYDHFVAWEFQKDIPILFSCFLACIPENYQYDVIVPKNIDIKKTELSPSTRSSLIATKHYFKKNISDPDGPNESYRNYLTEDQYSTECNNIMWEAKNIPPFQKNSEKPDNLDFKFLNYDYPKISRSGSYLAAIEFVTKKPSKDNWTDLNKYLLNHRFLGKQIFKTDFPDKDAIALAKSADNNFEKIKIITDYVQSNFSWNGEDKLFLSSDIKTIWKEKSGSSADLNAMLICLLSNANIQSYPLISSAIKGAFQSIPSIRNFNYLQTLIEINGTNYYFDITDLYRKKHEDKLFLVNKSSFVMSADELKLIDLTKIAKLFDVKPPAH